MTSKLKVLHLVDSVDYVRNNCFQHQLLKTMEDEFSVVLASIDSLQFTSTLGYDSITCSLKQRTLLKQLSRVKSWLGNKPFAYYDQDPWHAYMDDSPYKGAYEAISKELNVATIAVTTEWWADYINSRGIKSDFVRMWVLPEYCTGGKKFISRSTNVGFIGGLHQHRKRLFDKLDSLGVLVNVQSGGLDYKGYLRELDNIKIYIHSEDSKFTIDGGEHNLNVGLWAREIEVASRGCFSIRNNAIGSESYISGIQTAQLYDDPNEIPALIENILSNSDIAQAKIDHSVDHVRTNNEWIKTVRTLAEKGHQ